MTPEFPLFSIITVSYNAVKTIERTILSVLQQTYPSIEYIIIDGGSTDGTTDIIKRYEDRLAFWVSEPDKGIYDAMNKGIRHARGKYIGIINSDDWYAADALETVAVQMTLHPETDIFCGDMIIYYSKEMQMLVHSDPSRLKKKASVNHPTCFVRASVYQKKEFSLDYHSAGDFDFLLWCHLYPMKFKVIPHVLAYFTPGGVSTVAAPKHADSFYIWKHQIGTMHALLYYTRDYLGKAWKYPIKRLLISYMGNEKFWKIIYKLKHR